MFVLVVRSEAQSELFDVGKVGQVHGGSVTVAHVRLRQTVGRQTAGVDRQAAVQMVRMAVRNARQRCGL